MKEPARGAAARFLGQLGKQVNLPVVGTVLFVCAFLGWFAAEWGGFGPPSPYRPYAVGAMRDFTFRHRGAPMPPTVFHGANGKKLSLADFRGHPVLVNVWATWCPPCIKEMPSLDALQAAFRDQGFRVIAISQDTDGLDAVRPFIKSHGISQLDVYTDKNVLMTVALHAPGLPTSVLYGSDGREIGRLVGDADWDSKEARALIQAVIDQKTDEEIN